MNAFTFTIGADSMQHCPALRP